MEVEDAEVQLTATVLASCQYVEEVERPMCFRAKLQGNTIIRAVRVHGRLWNTSAGLCARLLCSWGDHNSTADGMAAVTPRKHDIGFRIPLKASAVSASLFEIRIGCFVV